MGSLLSDTICAASAVDETSEVSLTPIFLIYFLHWASPWGWETTFLMSSIFVPGLAIRFCELDYEGEIPKYYLLKTVTEENKDELQLLHFPKIKITFDELFEEID